MSPCDYCEKVGEAQQCGEIRGWLAGLDHKNHCTGDDSCPCSLFFSQEKKKTVKLSESDPDDTPLIDLTEKK